MSLNWNWNEAWDRFPKNTDGEISEEDRGTNDCFIWGTMSTGLDEITESNIEEWIVRAKMLSKAGYALGSHKNSDGERVDWIPTREQLEMRVGLSTNATRLTRAGFKKKIIKWLEEDAVKYAKSCVGKAEVC